MKWLQLISASVIILVATLVASDAVAGDIPEETAQPCVWISSADECATSGDIPIGSPVPVYDELDVYQLPNTGAGVTSRAILQGNYVSSSVDHWSFSWAGCAYGRYYFNYVGHDRYHRQVYGAYLRTWQGYC